MLSEHLEDFIQSVLAGNNAESYADAIEARLKKIFESCKFRTWSDISGSKVQLYLADRRNNGMSAQTSNIYLQAIKQFCRFMIRDGRASTSPVQHLKGLNVKTDRRHDRAALTVNEVRSLLESTKKGPVRFKLTGHERSLLYQLAVETGLRANELRSLTASSFDLDNLTITIEAGDSKHRRQDILPLRPDTAKLFKEFFKCKMPSVKLFRITRRSADMLKADLAEAGIDYTDSAGRFRDFHSLRHTTGSLLAAQGVHPKIIQSIMRHSNINLTMDRYTKTYRGQESEAVANLPDFNLPSKERHQQRATGTDGKNLAENLAFLGGLHKTTSDNNGQAALNSDSKTTVSHCSDGLFPDKKRMTI